MQGMVKRGIGKDYILTPSLLTPIPFTPGSPPHTALIINFTRSSRPPDPSPPNPLSQPQPPPAHLAPLCPSARQGTVRRSTDGDFIHANVDIDLIIGEEPEYGSPEKPTEIFHLIEHFCLGRRRLHVFGRDSTIRPGWVTIGPGVSNTNYKPSSLTF